MNKCKRCRSLLLEHFYGEMDTEKRKFFAHHLSVCEKCRTRFEKMEAVLQLTGQRVRPEPEQEFWDTYEQKLLRRIEKEEASRLGRKSSIEKRKRQFSIVPKWAYQAAAAVALIIIGVFLGRALFSPRVPGVQHAMKQPDSATKLEPAATLVHRSQDYIERSKLILLALVNFDSSEEDPYALDLPYQKQISKELVKEAGFLKEELAKSDQERLENLISSLEVILLQIANLESENDLDAIELVRDSIDNRGILLEINLSDIRRSTKKRKKAETF